MSEERARRALHRRLRLGAIGTSLLALAAGAVLFFRPFLSDGASTGGLARVQNAPVVGEQRSAVTFLDGSQALLSNRAHLRALQQIDKRVKLSQSTGTVRYQVRKNRERVFEVIARDVHVQVIGTIFSVTVLDDAIQVSVEQGRVRVFDTVRSVELGPGDHLRIVTQAAGTISGARPN
jgi:ferric-dicitrate binding protein FerR (iron transport regulator)